MNKYFVSYSYMTEKGLASHNCETERGLESIYDVEELEREIAETMRSIGYDLCDEDVTVLSWQKF
jgi:hypothetical protein